MSKKLLALNLAGATLLVGGAVMLVLIMRSRAVNIISAPAASTSSVVMPAATQLASSTDQNMVSGMPTKVQIPSLGIDLPVIPGYYDAKTGEWTLTTNKVQFATPTAQPNNIGGNTFLYGHARTNIFGSLPKIKAGAQAIVQTDNGHTFYYRLSSTRVVSPADSDSIFKYQGKPILTLQTCVGLLYQNRELLTFNLEQVV
jgi:LPXTG-site transpeptidase (sortase) family protein